MGRIGRSLQLVGQSYRVLMQDKELIWGETVVGGINLAVAAFCATDGDAAPGFDKALFEHAFVPKK